LLRHARPRLNAESGVPAPRGGVTIQAAPLTDDRPTGRAVIGRGAATSLLRPIDIQTETTEWATVERRR